MSVNSKLTAVADAIRAKTGGTDKLSLDAMAAEVAAMETGGEDYLAALFNNTLTQYSSEEMKIIPQYGFNSRLIATLNVPNVTEIGNYAFSYCSKITQLHFPKVTKIGSAAFQKSKLAAITAPLLKSVGSYGFAETNLAQCDFPALTTADKYAFNACRITSISLPSATGIGVAAFAACALLESADLGTGVTVLNDQVFTGCSVLTTLVLRSPTVCTMKYASALTNTPFASGGTGGTVYVPSALIESYQTATNWSTLYAAGTCSFVAIEGSEYE